MSKDLSLGREGEEDHNRGDLFLNTMCVCTCILNKCNYQIFLKYYFTETQSNYNIMFLTDINTLPFQSSEFNHQISSL